MTVHLCHFICAYANEQKFTFQIGTLTPMVLTNVFLLFHLFLIFVLTLFLAVTMNVAPFSAYKTHITRNSLHYLKFV